MDANVFLLQEPMSDMERGETVSEATSACMMLLLIDLSLPLVSCTDADLTHVVH